MEAMERMQLGIICSANDDDDDEPFQVAGREMMIGIIKAYGAREKQTLCLTQGGSIFTIDATPAPKNNEGGIEWVEDKVSQTLTRHFAMAPFGFDGRVFICGKRGWETSTSDGRFVWIYDPKQGKTLMGDISRPIEHEVVAVALLDGSVFVGGITAVRIYGLAGWTGPDIILPFRITRYAAALMPDGRVLISGGHRGNAGVTKLCMAFDPVSGGFDEVAPMRVVRYSHAAVSLPDGRIFVCGVGQNEDSKCEIYDPQENNWEPAASMLFRRVGHMAVIVYDVPPHSDSDDEKPVVLVSGGTVPWETGQSEFEAYDIESDKWYVPERFAFNQQMYFHGMCVVSHYE
jgi:hypothetical protein